MLRLFPRPYYSVRMQLLRTNQSTKGRRRRGTYLLLETTYICFSSWIWCAGIIFGRFNRLQLPISNVCILFFVIRHHSVICKVPIIGGGIDGREHHCRLFPQRVRLSCTSFSCTNTYYYVLFGVMARRISEKLSLKLSIIYSRHLSRKR